ncbi:MAG TPA: hypothetical protein VK807_23315 [Gemmatimonadaceae bacterium]|jgi:hypothetical protein|nr:hypothetical protein [Gemmatimonadaceae bacterium]
MNFAAGALVIAVGLTVMWLVTSGRADAAAAAFHAALNPQGSAASGSVTGPASTGTPVPNVSGTPATSLTGALPTAFGTGLSGLV